MWVSGEARGSQAETELPPQAVMLLRIWQEMKGTRSAPERGDLDLRQLPRLVPWLFIAEPRDTGFAWRLAGTGLCAFHGRELTGSDFLAGWERFEREAMGQALAAVTEGHDRAVMQLRFRTDRGQTIAAQLLALPMLAKDGATHVLGGLFPEDCRGLNHYDSLAPAELVQLRMLDGAMAETQARRKFRVISGGLDHG